MTGGFINYTVLEFAHAKLSFQKLAQPASALYATVLNSCH
jgi:hypothetical protein